MKTNKFVTSILLLLAALLVSSFGIQYSFLGFTTIRVLPSGLLVFFGLWLLFRMYTDHKKLGY